MWSWKSIAGKLPYRVRAEQAFRGPDIPFKSPLDSAMQTTHKLLLTFWLSFFAFAVPAGAEAPNSDARTLLDIAGVERDPARLSKSVLVIIDAQREYLDGTLPLFDIDASLQEAKAVLDRAREAGTPVIHVVHNGKPGGALFDPEGPYVAVADALSPKHGEAVVTKGMPNAFAGTDLEERLSRLGRKDLIVIGYMTHMCVSATVRAALDRGYRTTVVAKATATRDLPDGAGGVVSAQDVQRAALAALADRFATVVPTAGDLQ